MKKSRIYENSNKNFHFKIPLSTPFFKIKPWYNKHYKRGDTMEAYRLYKHILCIDLKSFYASVECALLGLDPFTTPLVVADPERSGGSVVLAISPYLKAQGVQSRCRVYELPKDKNIIIQKPRMQTYLEYSMRIVEVYLRFVSEEDLFIYSIDEVFIDVSSYLSYYQKTDEEIAAMILKAVLDETKIYATCGVGPNMLMAKLALDLESKKAPNFIAKWTYADIEQKLWSVSPLSKMWSIGPRMERRLNQMGFYEIGDIARSDVRRLKKYFGIIGEELYYHTHGIDQSILQNKHTAAPKSKSLGMGQTLFRDYYAPEIFTLLLEMVDEVVARLRKHQKMALTVHLGVAYSKHLGGGFSRQIKLSQASSNPSVIYNACVEIFEHFYQGDPIRRLHVHVSQLVMNQHYQYSLFEDAEKLQKEHDVFKAVDGVKAKFGKNSVTRAVSNEAHSTLKARNKMVGGHHA